MVQQNSKLSMLCIYSATMAISLQLTKSRNADGLSITHFMGCFQDKMQ